MKHVLIKVEVSMWVKTVRDTNDANGVNGVRCEWWYVIERCEPYGGFDSSDTSDVWCERPSGVSGVSGVSDMSDGSDVSQVTNCEMWVT